MRAVVQVEDGVVETNYMWLPTWLGLQHTFLKEAGEYLKQQAEGRPLNEQTLEELHNTLIDFICTRHSQVIGLKEHLNGLLKVKLPVEDGEAQG